MEVAWISGALVCGFAAKAIGLPALVGFLAAGFVLHGFGVEADPALQHIAHAGVLLLLFTVGLKLRIANLVRVEVWGTALVHQAVTAVLLGAGLHLVLGIPFTAAAVLGVALGFSSTVVTAKVLEEKRELGAFHGRVSIGILIIQDLVAVALLGVTAGLTPSPWALALLVLVVLGPLIGKLVDHAGHGELLVLLGLALALVVGGAGFASVGLSAELGALLLGALLARHPSASEIGDALWSIKEVFLVAFFLQIGMAGLPTLGGVALALVLLVFAMLKGFGYFWLLTRFRLRARTSFLAGTALATYSEFALIVAAFAVTQGLLEAHWLTDLALAVSLSFVAAAPLNRAAHQLWENHARALLRPLELDKRHPDDAPLSLGNAHYIVVGMGRVGAGAYDRLRADGFHVGGLDSDPGKIAGHLRAGRRVVYADAEDPGLWERIKLDGVHAVLLSLPDLESRVRAVTALRRRGFAGLVSAMTTYPDEAEPLLRAGCDLTYNFYDGAGGGLAERTLSATPATPEA